MLLPQSYGAALSLIVLTIVVLGFVGENIQARRQMAV